MIGHSFLIHPDQWVVSLVFSQVIHTNHFRRVIQEKPEEIGGDQGIVTAQDKIGWILRGQEGSVDTGGWSGAGVHIVDNG